MSVKLFAVLAACFLVGIAGLSEFSIREHRGRVFEALHQESTRLLTAAVQAHSTAILASDREGLRVVASELLGNVGVAYLRFDFPGTEEPLVVGSQEPRRTPTSLATLRSEYASSRLVGSGSALILDVAVPLNSVVPAIALSGNENQTRMSLDVGSMTIGRDVTPTHVALRSAANLTRIAQTAISGVMLLVLWIVIQWLLRPIAVLTELAQKIGDGAESVEFGRGSSTEAQKSTLGLKAVLRRYPPIGGTRSKTARVNPRLGSGGRNFSGDSEADPPYGVRHGREGGSSRPIADDSRVHPHRVLVVEDNPVNRSLAVEMLEALGCEVVCAEDGEASLLAIEAEPFDLVLMDIQMPRMDGFEATRRIRAKEERMGARPTPIVALTAHSQPEDRIAAARAGMDDHISKPFTQEDLRRAIHQWCASAKLDA